MTTPQTSGDSRVLAALREFHERFERGEKVDRERFLAERPEIADELRVLLANGEEARRMAAPFPAGSPGATHSDTGAGQQTRTPQGRKPGSPAELPAQFGRYRIVRALGSGAMGTVYLAADTQLQREVALKTSSFDDDGQGELLERFYREAKSAATLRHSNICPVYDVGEIEGRHFISMAYIEGEPLSAHIRPGKPFPERQALIVARKLALALQEAHDHGVIHRDLKPGNIMVDGKAEPIITDFGLALSARHEGQARLTQSGMIVGSPAYMSPEQVQADPDRITPATDQYSLGVILFEMLTGSLPFSGSIAAIIGAILTKEPPRPGALRPGLDPRLEALCLKMMAKSADDRFPSCKAAAAEMAATFKALPTGSGGAAKVPPASATLPLDASIPAPAAPRTAWLPDVDSANESDQVALAGAAKKCLARHDYEQVAQMLEQVPEHRRTPEIAALLERARGLADQVVLLLSDIDEATRRKDSEAALRKAQELQRLKPGHHRVREIQKEYGRYGKGRALRDGGSRLLGRVIGEESGFLLPATGAFVLVLLLMLGAVTLYLRAGSAVVKVTINDPEVKVDLQGKTFTMEDSGRTARVNPGETVLTIHYGNLEFQTRRFRLGKGDNPAIQVELLDGALAAKFGEETLHEAPVEELSTAGVAEAADAGGNYALEFDGRTSHVESPTGSWETGDPPLTIEAWVDPTFDNDLPASIAHLGGPYVALLNLTGTNNPRKERHWAGLVLTGESAPGRPSAGVRAAPQTGPGDLRHVAFVLDQTKARLFENGKLIEEAEYQGRQGAARIEDNSPGIQIGAQRRRVDAAWGFRFHGTLDEVRISRAARYEKDFTPERRFEPDRDTLALYHFDEGLGDVAKDASGNGHDATITGAKWLKLEGAVQNSVLTPAPAGGGWIDLLSQTQPDDQNSQGNWERNAQGQLEAHRSDNFPQLSLPARPRESYEVEIGLRVDAPRVIILHVPAGPAITSFVLGAKDGGRAGLELRGVADPRKKPSRYSRRVSFEAEREHVLRAQVRVEDTQVRIDSSFDGEPLPAFRGSPKFLKPVRPRRKQEVPGLAERFGIEIGGRPPATVSATFTRFRYRPLSEAASVAGNAWIDLLASVAPGESNSRGAWTRTPDGSLHSDRTESWPFPQLSFAAHPAGSYQLEFGVRLEKCDHVILHVPAGTGIANLTLGRRLGGAVWQKEGPFAPMNQTDEQKLSFTVEPDKDYLVRVSADVARDGSRVKLSGTIDGRQLPTLDANPKELSAVGPPVGLKLKAPPLPSVQNELSVHIGLGSTATITRMRYRTLDGAGRGGALPD